MLKDYEELGYRGFSYLIREIKTGKIIEFPTYTEAYLFMHTVNMDELEFNEKILHENKEV